MSEALYGFATGFATGLDDSIKEQRANQHDKEMADKRTEVQKSRDIWLENRAAYKAKNALFTKTQEEDAAKAVDVQNIIKTFGLDVSRTDEITRTYELYGGTAENFMEQYNNGNISFNATTPLPESVVHQTDSSLSSEVSPTSFVNINVKQASNKGKTLASARLHYDKVTSSDAYTQEQKKAARDEYTSLINLRRDEKIIDNIDGDVTLKVQGEDGITLLHNVTPNFTPDGMVYTDPQGNRVENAVVLPEDEEKEVAAVLKSVSIPTQDHKKTVHTVSRVTSLAGDLIGIVDTNPDVLASFTAGTASMLVGVQIELKAAQSLLSNPFGDSDSNGEDTYVTLKEFEERLLPNGVSLESLATSEYVDNPADRKNAIKKLAHASDTFNAKMILMAFRAGGVEGQVGMAMSNKDFDRLKEVVASSKDPETFKTQLAEYVNDGVSGLNRSAEMVNDDPKIRGFRKLYGYDPLMGDSLVKDFDTLVRTSKDERFKAGAALIKQYAGVSPTDNGEQSVSTTVETPRFTPEQIRAEIERRKSLQRGE